MSGREDIFAGPTYRDIFLQRLRSGTFEKRDMPNHAFIAILTENQISGSIGKKWAALLKQTGFEFIRTVANSVYTGTSLSAYSKNGGTSLNHIFMLVRNIGQNGAGNPYLPPKAWSDLPSVLPELWERLDVAETDSLSAEVHMGHTKIWNDLGVPKFLKRSELPKDVPVTLAGQRVAWGRQQTVAQREQAKVSSGLFPEASETIFPSSVMAVTGDPFSIPPVVGPQAFPISKVQQA